ncbi:Inner membrane protein YihY, formerly thought to be RNase BN [hydrothermal vent metagenome]|uniref:Inner membrane protein YihY, formerly thought to be RNase BN n=1 Tax=hydrothermal vent metagenome TaxID=652676 RepID=A0A3B1E3R8_9ZZZZ
MKKNDKNKVGQCIQFLQTDIWRIRANKLSGQKSFWIRQLRIVLLAIRGFAEDKCQLRASALTFYSLLSIVPVVAMGFGVAKGFGFEKKLETQILEGMQGQEEVAQQIINFSQSFLENTQGGLIAGVGVFVLFWTIIKVLGHIENSFNDVWGIKKDRSFGRKFSDYLSIMMVCPILLIMSSSITVLVTSQVTLIVEKLSFLGPLSDVIIFSLRILPYAVIWGVFTFIYIFMPNTNVRFKAGLMGGIIAGTIYQMVQWAYITFQVGVAKFGAIYGSFAALPLFLVWLQTSWLVVLLGAEVSFAEQNVETYEFEPDCLKISHSFKRLLSLGIMHSCIKNFHDAQKAQTAENISHQFEIPIRLVHQIMFELTESGLLSEVKSNEDKTIAYQPSYDIENVTIENVLMALDQRGIDNIPIVDTEEIKKIIQSLNTFRNLIEKSPSNVILKNI